MGYNIDRVQLFFSLVGLSTVARAGLSAPLLTSELRQHLSQLLAEYHGLQDKANTLTHGGRDHKLYQQMSSLEPVVKLVQNLEAKEKVVKAMCACCLGISFVCVCRR